MQHALQKLGWKILYWNPNPAHNEAWDASERRTHANDKGFWGWHADRYRQVTSRGTYYWNQIDDPRILVGFGTQVPVDFAKVPFFVGTAHTGYHVFPGKFGQVIEAHSMRALTDPQTIEGSQFNPLESGGGPRGEYRSGLIAIPPGYDL